MVPVSVSQTGNYKIPSSVSPQKLRSNTVPLPVMIILAGMPWDLWDALCTAEKKGNCDMRSRLVQAAAFLLVSFGLFIAVAAFLYHYNNKYENTMVYPMGGVVFLDEGTLNQDKPLFLAISGTVIRINSIRRRILKRAVWKTAVIHVGVLCQLQLWGIRKGRPREAVPTV